jgi:hypothetical protein
MAEASAYNKSTMRLLMSSALGVEYDQTEEVPGENQVTCPSKNVTSTCDEAGADDLVERAVQRMATADQTRFAANEAFDVVDRQLGDARGIANGMRQANGASLVAPPEEA